MNKKEWDKAEKEFNIIFELSGEERGQYLSNLKLKNPGLFDNVKRILDFSENTGSFLKNDVLSDYKGLINDIADKTNQLNSIDFSNRIVGKYRIIKKLGHGGMGAVYLGERADSSYAQRVALKFIRTDLHHSLILERFKREQQIQALLVHPSIPKLYDADTDDMGTPYIVMEYIDGVSITSYVQNNQLSVDQKLRLFIQMCEVIHFAHQNLVIHRDLKPSNILITADGDCKLLDFGISKLLDNDKNYDLTRSDIHFISLKYAAPEQIENKPVTTSTDVYALGIILHELLCNIFPYDIESKTPSEIEQTICEIPIKKPSTSLIQTGNVNDKNIRLSRILKGDLDNIILKALEKEPSRRYSSVKAFAEDVENYLLNKPVSARPAGIIYTAGKFVRRNKISVTFTIVILLMMLSAFVYHSIRIGTERDIALIEARKFEQMAGFMINLFDYDELEVPPEEAKITNLLDAGVKKLESELDDNSETKAEIMMAIGKSHLKLGNISSGYEIISDAVEIIENLSDYDQNKKAESYYNLSYAMFRSEHPDRMKNILSTLDFIKQNQGEMSYEYARILWLKGSVYRHANQTITPEVEEIFDRYFAIMEQIFLPEDPEFGLAVFEYAVNRSNHDERQEKLKYALEINKNMHGQYHPRVANILNSMAYGIRISNTEKSIQYYKEAIDIYVKLYGESNYRAINSLTNLGASYRRMGEHEKAIETFKKSFELSLSVYSPGSIRVADQQFWLANAYLTVGNLMLAKMNFMDVLEVFKTHYDPGTQKVELARILLGDALNRMGRSDEAITLLEQSIENVTNLYGENHSLINMARSRM